jgi:hypothetical protein
MLARSRWSSHLTKSGRPSSRTCRIVRLLQGSCLRLDILSASAPALFEAALFEAMSSTQPIFIIGCDDLARKVWRERE